jgi:hypothetical protein
VPVAAAAGQGKMMSTEEAASDGQWRVLASELELTTGSQPWCHGADRTQAGSGS